MPKINWVNLKIPDDHVIELVKEDLRALLSNGLKRPSDLISHTVFLTNELVGPVVYCWGDKDSDEFICEHEPYDACVIYPTKIKDNV